MSIKKEVALYKAWCKRHNLRPQDGTSLTSYFKQSKGV